jgi:hypothetical protein
MDLLSGCFIHPFIIIDSFIDGLIDSLVHWFIDSLIR